MKGLFDLTLELLEAHVRDLLSWEQVLNKRGEQRQVVLQELGHIAITHGSNQHDVLFQVLLSALQGTGHDKHGFDGTHPEVVVILLRELLRRQLVKLDHLLR